MSAIRFVLEQLATREVFGSLTTGTTPTLLGEGFAPWLFEMEKCELTLNQDPDSKRANIDICARAREQLGRGARQYRNHVWSLPRHGALVDPFFFSRIATDPTRLRRSI